MLDIWFLLRYDSIAMMASRSNQQRCTCGIAGLLTLFVVLSAWGAVITSRVSPDGLVARCPILGSGKAMCVDVTGHLQIWRDAFMAARPTETFQDGALLMVLLGMGGGLLFVGARRFVFQLVGPRRRSCQPRKQTPGWIDYLSYLFSQGILHPKRF